MGITAGRVERQGAHATAIRGAADAMADVIRVSEVATDRIMGLLIACGRLPTEARDEEKARPSAAIKAPLDRFAAFIASAVEAALYDLIENEEEHVADIRRFFLEPKESYSIDELAAIWRIPAEDVRAIYHDELLRRAPAREDQDRFRIFWDDAIGATISRHLLRPWAIERALGVDFERVRDAQWRTVSLVVHAPWFIVESSVAGLAPLPRVAFARRVEDLLPVLFETGQLMESGFAS